MKKMHWRKNTMKIKMICSLLHTGLEKEVNRFLEENRDKIEVIEIRWKLFLEHHVMIVYKEKFQ